MKLGIFGRPIGHTKSPKLFRALGRELGFKIEYEAVEVMDGGLGEAIARARAKGWSGANVTIPFKLEAAVLAERLTPAAKALGAVNTLRFGKMVEGHNTDADGLRDALRRSGVIVRGKTALIFGAGGAARAAGWALAREGAKSVRFTGRTTLTATKCARVLAPSFPKTSFSAGAARNADIWINATPLGMKGHPDKSPAGSGLRAPETAVDLVYGKETAFQRQTKRMGARVYDGTGMLACQALRGYEFFTAPLGARRAALAERLIKELS